MKQLLILLLVCWGIAGCEKSEIPEQNEHQKAVAKDNVSPDITITSPTDYSYQKGMVSIQGYVTDDIGVKRVVVSDQFGRSWAWEAANKRGLKNFPINMQCDIGLNDTILTFEAWDSKGNPALPKTLTLLVLLCNTCPE